MIDVRNSDGKLVCRFYEKEQIIEIVFKNCITIIRINQDKIFEIINKKIK